MKFLTISLLAIATLFNISAYAACPPAGETVLSTQADVDNFFTNFPGCTMLPANVELTIRGAGITDLDGLNGITSIAGTLNIKGCPNLTDITGLSTLTTGGEIDFEGCTSLTSLDGLQNLTTLTDDLEFSNMDALVDITDLSNLTTLGGELYFKECAALTNLEGLEGLTSVGTSVTIDDCDALVSLEGLNNITSIGTFLRIEFNEKLDDLTALSNLTSVGTSVYILDNPNLSSLDGLDNITSIGLNLDIYDNPNLVDCIGACEMLQVVDPANVDIQNNGPGQCSDVTILENDCLIALPVELSKFRAKENTKNATVVLNWTTDSEIDNKHFEVERAADARNFEVIGTVAGNGTTTKVHNYEFVDAKPIATAYYRLKQVDFAGHVSYSDIVLVEMTEASAAEVEAFPTVAKNEINLRFKGFEAQNGTYNVFDAQGRLVHSEDVDLSNKMAYKSLNTSKFRPGIYTIVIIDNSNHISTNFVVVK